MALVKVGGNGFYLPTYPSVNIPASFATSLTIDATGEKLAFSGRVFFPERTGTKDIRRVCFRFGTVTKAGGSAMTISLQDVNLSGGPPGQPDETQDQTVAIANGDSSFASNTWYRSGTLSTDRTVSFSDRLSVVLEYDGGGRLGSDTVTVSTLTAAGTTSIDAGSVVALKTGTWAVQNVVPNVILEFSDGTFGTLGAHATMSAVNTHTYNSGTAGADEYALEFQVPFACSVDAAWVAVSAAASADFQVILYEGTTALATGTIDQNEIAATNSGRFTVVQFSSEVSLAANTTYRLAVKPTTANNISVYSIDVADANHFSIHAGGSTFTYTTRVDAGSWASATTTRRLFAGIRVSSIHDGAGGGGLMVHPGMAGGMRG